MGEGDNDEKKGGVRGAVSLVRGGAAAVQRALALGTLAVVLGMLITLTFTSVLGWIIGSGEGLGEGPLAQVLEALVVNSGLLIALPLLAWMLSWAFEDRPIRLGIGAAIFALAWNLGIQYLSVGARGLMEKPVRLTAWIVFGLAAGLLAAWTFARGRAAVEARERRSRRIAPESKDDPPAGDEDSA